jgi:hypothetical protein
MKMKFTKKTILKIAASIVLSVGWCANSYAQPLATIVVGTGTSTIASGTMPYYDYYWGSKVQYLILASELTSAGMLPGNINSIGFEVTNVASVFAQNNFYLSMKTTTATALTTTWETGLTQVISPSISYTPVANSVNTHTLTAPFYWNGTSNIVIEMCHNNSSYNTNGASTSVKYGTYTFNATHSVYTDAATVCSAPGAGSTAMTRPNIFFGVDVPPNNSGVTAVTAPVPGDTLFCSGVKEIKVNVHNFGNNTINGVNVNWKVNGVLQTPVNYTTMIDMENTTGGPNATVSLGNWTFPYNVAQNIVAWTSLPNGVADTRPANDSTSKTVKSTLLGINDFALTPQDTTICIGSTIVIDAGVHPKNPIYIWNNASLTQTINVSTPGSYGVKVQNTDGCVAYDTIHVSVYPNPVVNSIAIIDNQSGSYTFNVIGAQNVTKYKWDFGDSTPSDFVNGTPSQQLHTFVNSGQYTVTLTLKNDCGETIVERPVTTSGATGTGVSNVSMLQREISIFPNPSKAMVSISNSSKIRMKSIAVFNLLGQKVFENGKVNAEKYDLNISDLSVGIYNVIIDTEIGSVTKKLEVIR